MKKAVTLALLILFSATTYAQLTAGDLIDALKPKGYATLNSRILKCGYMPKGDTLIGNYNVHYYLNNKDKCGTNTQVLVQSHKEEKYGSNIHIYTNCDKTVQVFVRSFRRWGYKKTGTSSAVGITYNTYTSNQYPTIVLTLKHTPGSSLYKYEFDLNKIEY